MCSERISPGAQLERSRRPREIRELREELDALAKEMQQVETAVASFARRLIGALVHTRQKTLGSPVC